MLELFLLVVGLIVTTSPFLLAAFYVDEGFVTNKRVKKTCQKLQRKNAKNEFRHRLKGDQIVLTHNIGPHPSIEAFFKWEDERLVTYKLHNKFKELVANDPSLEKEVTLLLHYMKKNVLPEVKNQSLQRMDEEKNRDGMIEKVVAIINEEEKTK